MNTDFKEYIVQIFMIVFSVVLGLYLNERIVQYHEKNEAEKLFSFIKKEVNNNRLILKEWGPYHREIKVILDSISQDDQFIADFIKDENALYNAILSRGTFMQQGVSSQAWDVAKGNPILLNIGFENMMLLSRLYDQQNITFEPFQELFDVFQMRGFNDKANAKESVRIIADRMHELVGREMSLQTFYRMAAKKFDLKDKPEEQKKTADKSN